MLENTAVLKQAVLYWDRGKSTQDENMHWTLTPIDPFFLPQIFFPGYMIVVVHHQHLPGNQATTTKEIGSKVGV